MLGYRTEINADIETKGSASTKTPRTVTWECDTQALNGFHERVGHSSRYPLVCLTKFYRKYPFPRVGHIRI